MLSTGLLARSRSMSTFVTPELLHWMVVLSPRNQFSPPLGERTEMKLLGGVSVMVKSPSLSSVMAGLETEVILMK